MTPVTCSHCLKLMVSYDLHEIYCKQVALVVTMDELICTECGAAVLRVADVHTPEEPCIIGRTESIELTCFSERVPPKLSESYIIGLVHAYYLDYTKNICSIVFGANWVVGFEVYLWQALNNLPEAPFRLSLSCISKLQGLNTALNLWPVLAACWDINNTHGEYALISNASWCTLYKNKTTIFRNSLTHESDT